MAGSVVVARAGAAAGDRLAAVIAPVLLLLAALGARLALESWRPSAGLAAGAAFGVLLLAGCRALGWRGGRPSIRQASISLALGVIVAAVLVALPVWLHPETAAIVGIRPQPYAVWVGVTVLVAVGEEVLLRGVLFDRTQDAAGPVAAVALTSVAFAMLHVPLYGLGVVPLDLAVGVALGGSRLASGGVTTPALAHVLADLATWW